MSIKKPLLHNFGKDSQLRKARSVPDGSNNSVRLRQAMVGAVYQEGRVASMGVKLVDASGSDLGIADWPYPGFVTGKAGIYGTGSEIHGLYTSPQIGMSVLTGFRDGSQNAPIVINSYAIPLDPSPISRGKFVTPMLSAGHMYDDVVMGHYSGAYIGLRAALPFPGEVDIYSPSAVDISGDVSVTLSSLAKMSFSSTTYSVDSKTTLDLTALQVNLSTTAGTSYIKMSDVTGIELNNPIKTVIKTNWFEVQDTIGNKLKFMGGIFTVEGPAGKAAMTQGNVYAMWMGGGQVDLLLHTHTTAVGNSSPGVG